MMRHVYSVGQVNSYIKNMFAQDFMLKSISIKGEVSNCKYHSSGHIYFTVKDGNGAMRAVMFAGSRKGLTFPMKEGDKVIVTGSVEVYERDGTYQIYAKQIEPDGEGSLFLKFERLKKELEEMGMFAPEYKQPIPRFIRTLGVVTARTGAAIQDIRNIAGRRNPYVQIILYPAQVQGVGAAESIVSGIHALEQLGVDVIIVGRGGGSIEDLWAFNEEIVARAIFDCGIPIISAVGHETDTTIADYVADLRAPTPSAAAELAVFDIESVMEYLMRQENRMARVIRQQTALFRERIAHIKTRLVLLSPANRMNENRTRLVHLEEELNGSMIRLLADKTVQAEAYKEALGRAMERMLSGKRSQLLLLANSLEGRSPIKRLSEGYAFVEGPNGKGIATVEQLHPSDEMTVQMLDGRIKAVVAEVWKNEREQ